MNGNLQQLRQGLDKGIHIFLIALCFTLPISKGAASTSMVALCILSFVRLFVAKVSLWKRARNYPGIAVLSLLFFLYFLSLAYSQDLAYGWKFTLRHISLFALAGVLLVNIAQIRTKIIVYLWAFMAALGLNCLLTLYFYALAEEQALQTAHRLSFLNIKPYVSLSKRTAFGLYSPFISRLQFSNLLAIGTCFLAYLYAQQRVKSFWALAIAILFLYTSFVLGGRAGQLGLTMGILVWLGSMYFQHVHLPLYTTGRKGKAWILHLSLVTVFLFLTFGVGYSYLPKVSDRYGQLKWEIERYYSPERDSLDLANSTAIRRIISWQNNWELIRKHPVLGVGIGDYESKLKDIYLKNHPNLAENAHNQFLMIWACTGLLGLVLFMGSMGFWLKRQRKEGRFYLWVLSMSVLAVWATIFLFDATLNFQIDAMAFVLSCGFCSVLATDKPVFSPLCPPTS